MTTIRPPLVDRNPLWTVARGLGVLLTLVLLGGLVEWPTLSLHILWDMVIPLLPAVFLINPMLWRNVCPLATLNEATGRRGRGGSFTTRRLVALWGVGITLLVVMVPARRFLFNTNGIILATTITVVSLLALGLGLLASRRGGFCNAVCPVLPVEKLYGQSPLVGIGSARCPDCNHCTASGCIDLAGGRSARQSIRLADGPRWLLNPFGIFAASFPGLVIGYFVTTNTTPAHAGAIYLTVAGWMAASLVVTFTLVALLRVRPTVMLPILGAAAVGCYYWFGAPGIATAYGLPPVGGTVIRILALVLVATWLRQALRSRATERP